MKVIQVTNTYKGEVLEIVRSCVPAGFELRTLEENTEVALASCVGDADYLLASGRVKITRGILARAKKLKMLQRTGVGLDSLDLEALQEAGIPLYVNQGVNAQSVAEHALLLMMACLRNLPQINQNTKEGIWSKQQQGVKTRELAGKTVAVIGMGSTGKALAALLKPFGVTLLYTDQKRLPPQEEERLGARWCDSDSIYGQADILTLHCPLTPENKHLISEKTLARMKNGAILINTARGGLVCEESLAQALHSGKIYAAGLDVYEQEPVRPDNPLLHAPRVITTPHIAGVTYDSFYRMMHDAMRNIELFEEGKLQEIQPYRYKG